MGVLLQYENGNTEKGHFNTAVQNAYVKTKVDFFC